MSEFIQLKNTDAVIRLVGLVSVQSIDTKGSCWNVHRAIRLTYQDGTGFNLPYGSDDTYHHNDLAKRKRDDDFKLISKQLVNQNGKERDE